MIFLMPAKLRVEIHTWYVFVDHHGIEQGKCNLFPSGITPKET